MLQSEIGCRWGSLLTAQYAMPGHTWNYRPVSNMPGDTAVSIVELSPVSSQTGRYKTQFYVDSISRATNQTSQTHAEAFLLAASIRFMLVFVD